MHGPGFCRRIHAPRISDPARERASRLRRALVRWQLPREFPWRETTDIYRLAIAEILLQKTRAASVAPVYLNLVERYSDVNALASARYEDLQSMLEPLGLSRKRADAMISLSQTVSKIGWDKTLSEGPRPGLGAYGERAVRCFALGERVGIVDANVRRVLRRAVGLRTNCETYFQAVANELVSGARDPRHVNYALLDVGALFCAATPRCASCPLRPACAYASRRTPPLQT